MPGSANTTAKTAVQGTKTAGQGIEKKAASKAGSRFANRLPTLSHPERQHHTRQSTECECLALP
jgi:hypothetical protein